MFGVYISDIKFSFNYKMNISIAILFGGKLDQTIECINSLKGYHFDILANGVSKEELDKLKNHVAKLDAEVYESPNNLGVAKGRNYLIKKIKADWIFFIDNDITVSKGWEKEFKKTLKEHPTVKVFVPRIFNKHLGKFEDLYAFSLAIEGKVNAYIRRDGITNKVFGGASIIHKSLFKEIGNYDERFFVGFEDYEISIRAIKMNKEIKAVEIPTIQLVHDHRQSQSKEDNEYLKTRYNVIKIKESYDLIKKIHGLELPDDGVKWSKRKIEQMENKTIESKYIRVAIYTTNLVAIGGTETSIRNFCKRMCKYYEITFYYTEGDSDSIAEISQWANVVKWKTGNPIDTDIFISNTCWGHRPDKEVKAKKYVQILHGDFEWMKKKSNFDYKRMSNTTLHVAVGKNVAEKFKKLYKEEPIIIHNLLDLENKPQRVLRLISVTRIGYEKGFERMEIMARKLKEANIKFLWLVYGSGHASFESVIRKKFQDIQEVVFMGVNKDTSSQVADSDYLVALSDSEGFSYSIYEALQVGTPCIVTDFPSAYEQIEDGKSGYILKMDLSNLDIKKIYNTIPKNFKFKELSTEKDWIKVLGGNGKEIPFKKHKNSLVKVKTVLRFKDIRNKNLIRRIDEVFQTDELRARELESRHFVIQV